MAGALERVELIKKVIASDGRAMQLVGDVIRCANSYIQSVNTMERSMKSAQFRMETDQYQRLVMQLDQRRRILHDALLSQLNITNRYLFKNFKEEIPVGGLFSHDPSQYHDRAAIGDWAFELINEIASREKEATQQEEAQRFPHKQR